MVRQGPPSILKRQYIVDRKFQWKLILQGALPLIGLLILFGLGLFYLIEQLKATFYFANINELIIKISTELGSDISSEKIFSTVSFWAFLGLGVIAVLALGYAALLFLIFSHRIAGPMFRFKRVIETVAEGDLTVTVKLRDRDEFQDTAKALDSAIQKMRGRIQNVHDLNTHLTKTILKMQADSSESNKALFNELAGLSKEIGNNINEFRFQEKSEP